MLLISFFYALGFRILFRLKVRFPLDQNSLTLNEDQALLPVV